MRILTALAVTLALAGCNAKNESTLIFNGDGYEPHDGMTVRGTIVDSAGLPGETHDQLVVDGGFSMGFYGLEEGEYLLYWFVDVSGNDLCDAPPTDHVWSSGISMGADDQTYEHEHDTDFNPDACPYIDED